MNVGSVVFLGRRARWRSAAFVFRFGSFFGAPRALEIRRIFFSLEIRRILFRISPRTPKSFNMAPETAEPTKSPTVSDETAEPTKSPTVSDGFDQLDKESFKELLMRTPFKVYKKTKKPWVSKLDEQPFFKEMNRAYFEARGN